MSGDVLREFCAENFELVPSAIASGARRIELCDNLAVGGTSPSVGVIWKTVRYAHERGVRVTAMVRPRGGGFCYCEDELQMMEADIDSAISLGADGVVFGCTSGADNGALRLDRRATQRLVSAVRTVDAERKTHTDITFHMAFDDIAPEFQFEAIDELARLGVSRILTHGGVAGTSIADNFERLRELISYAGERLIVLPGAGITFENVHEVVAALGVSEVHGTKIVPLR